ncbi:hypothetical protein CW709_05005, partial [Candidatus Bathyarchaeota archaeon]
LEKGLSMLVENVKNYLLGKPTNLVNKPV